jgi:hypothetical protein
MKDLGELLSPVCGQLAQLKQDSIIEIIRFNPLQELFGELVLSHLIHRFSANGKSGVANWRDLKDWRPK